MHSAQRFIVRNSLDPWQERAENEQHIVWGERTVILCVQREDIR